jgi:hypothetical protein
VIHLRLTRIARLLLVAVSLPGLVLAQTQLQTPPLAQPQSQQAQSGPVAGSPKPEADKSNSATRKVFTNHDLKELPPGDISVVGPTTPPTGAISQNGKAPGHSVSANQADQDAKAAAYWKSRFTAARNKLAQDKKALPSLQSQLEVERVQQTSVDPDTGQVNSDEFTSILHQIDATKLAIKNDRRALNDLHEQFRKAGGQPGWIR